MHVVFLTVGNWRHLTTLFEEWERIPYTRRGENIVGRTTGPKYDYVRFREYKLRFRIAGADVYVMEAIFMKEIKNAVLRDMHSFTPLDCQSWSFHNRLKLNLLITALRVAALFVGVRPVNLGPRCRGLKEDISRKGYISHWAWILIIGIIEDKIGADGYELT